MFTAKMNRLHFYVTCVLRTVNLLVTLGTCYQQNRQKNNGDFRLMLSNIAKSVLKRMQERISFVRTLTDSLKKPRLTCQYVSLSSLLKDYITVPHPHRKSFLFLHPIQIMIHFLRICCSFPGSTFATYLKWISLVHVTTKIICSIVTSIVDSTAEIQLRVTERLERIA